MTSPAGHEGELPLDSPDEFPVDDDGAPGGEGAPWADGPGHGPADDLPPPDEVPPSPS